MPTLAAGLDLGCRILQSAVVLGATRVHEAARLGLLLNQVLAQVSSPFEPWTYGHRLVKDVDNRLGSSGDRWAHTSELTMLGSAVYPIPCPVTLVGRLHDA